MVFYRSGIALIFLVLFTATVQATIIVNIIDDVDDIAIVKLVYDQEDVKAFRKDLFEFQGKLGKLEEPQLEKILGKPGKRSDKPYAFPVAQPRLIAISGFRYADAKLNKDHIEFYPIGDIGAIEVWYGPSGTDPQAILVCLKTDKDFPKLTKTNLKERLAWDRERFDKLKKLIKIPDE